MITKIVGFVSLGLALATYMSPWAPWIRTSLEFMFAIITILLFSVSRA